jgi:general secretion pathway protein D
MKKTKRSMQAKRGATGWRHVTAAMLLCGLIMAHPVQAQDPASNQATLNFADADIESVIKAVGHYTNTTFLIDPRVKGTITVVSEKPLTKKQAFDLLTSTLRMQGYAVVMSDGFAKVVPEADAKLQAGPIKAERIRGDQIATQIFRLRHESATGLVPVLRPLISPNNTINAYPGNNALVITDYADNLRRLERIINSLDRPLDSEIEIIPVEHAAASDLIGILTRLMSETPAPATPTRGNANVQTSLSAGAGDLLVDPRTNSIIVRGASPSYIRKVRSLVERLDQPTSRPGNVHVIHLRNAEATQLAQTLRAIVAGETATPGGTQQSQGQQNSQGASGANTTGGLQPQPLGSTQPQQQGPLPTGGPAGFIQADPTTNTLIITASEPVYRNLRAVIDQLDSRRAQVYVESLIVEVSASRAAEFGVQWAGLSGDSASDYRVGTLTGFNQGGNNLINQVVASATTGTPLPPSNGLNFGIFRQVNGQLTLGALARALETEDDANILSMPNLITLDNEEARIIVGQNVPFITGQFTTAASGGGTAGVNPFQTIEREDIGLSLRVRPQISEGGTVKMAIYQETSSIQDTTTSGLITSKRSIETNVLVDDGQIVVLGGLIDDTLEDSVEKVPGLGDIPILGNLFKYQSRSRVKRNLMVFLRPTVIRTPERSLSVTTDRYDYIRNAGILSQSNPPRLLPDMGPLLLPPMINGQIVEPPLLQVNLNRMGAVPREVIPVPPGGEPLDRWTTPASPSPVPPAEPSMDLRAPQ